MIQLVFIAFLFLAQDDIPFKAKEDFEIKFDMAFKMRPQRDVTKTVHVDETRAQHDARNNAAQLPYLKLKIKIVTAQPNEVKLKVFKDAMGSTVLNKKIESGYEFVLEPGFLEDIKAGVSGYKHVIEFYSAEKVAISKILIEFDNEGNYVVNGEKRGKI